jgi:hypothetical protein
VIPVGILLGGVIPLVTVSVTTYGATTLDAFRRAVPGAGTTVSETIPVHTATSRRLLDKLPEIDRRRETIALYAAPGSALADVDGSAPPTVVYRGRTYQRTHIGDYAEQGGILLVLASLVDDTS